MAQIYPLKLNKPDDVILADAVIKNHTASLVLDTGATNTIIDLNTLLIAGYTFKSEGRKKFETANGILEADRMLLDQLLIWEQRFEKIIIYTIDFMDTGIISPYEGVVGLDILKKFCITFDFPGGKLTIN